MASTLEPITRVEQFLSDIIDQGGGGGGSGGASALIVHMDEQTNTLDKTWQEIHDAAPLVWYEEGEGVYDQLSGCVFYPDSGYLCTFFGPIASRLRDFMAEAPNAYPIKQG